MTDQTLDAKALLIEYLDSTFGDRTNALKDVHKRIHTSRAEGLQTPALRKAAKELGVTLEFQKTERWRHSSYPTSLYIAFHPGWIVGVSGR